ncbi:hypothetical protein BDL97_14G097000 [Sphagnum fallax]|nr:hypothetical protein BDL97_14G097000 [Sphagnum fallax]
MEILKYYIIINRFNICDRKKIRIFHQAYMT